jgi:transposase
MLVELRLMEQRYQAVLEVLEGASVSDVARRFGVARQTVHVWMTGYANHGLAGLADKSSKPLSCPHQMSPEVEARIVEMRREHGGGGPRTILYWLGQEGFDPLPGRTSVERCLTRHGLVEPKKRGHDRSSVGGVGASRPGTGPQTVHVGPCSAATATAVVTLDPVAAPARAVSPSTIATMAASPTATAAFINSRPTRTVHSGATLGHPGSDDRRRVSNAHDRRRLSSALVSSQRHVGIRQKSLLAGPLRGGCESWNTKR